MSIHPFTRRPAGDDWLERRREYIGASDSAAMLGYSPWSGPLTLFMNKTEGYQQATTAAMRIGTALEPVILDMWAEETGGDLYE